MDIAFWNNTERYILDKLEPHILNRRFYIELDGKIKLQKKVALDIPWVFIRGREFGDCYLYKDVFFDIFGIIPSFCQYICWKVVIKPKTIKELFDLYEVLRDLNFASKCGLETRNYVKGNYAGFIYCTGEDEGQKKYQEFKEKMPNMECYLKRGCTEFEALMSSNQWRVTPEQKEMEIMLMSIFQVESIPPYQPQWVINHIKRKWIAFASKIGDETYKEIISKEFIDELYVHSIQYQKENVCQTSEDMINTEKHQS